MCVLYFGNAVRSQAMLMVLSDVKDKKKHCMHSFSVKGLKSYRLVLKTKECFKIPC